VSLAIVRPSLIVRRGRSLSRYPWRWHAGLAESASPIPRIQIAALRLGQASDFAQPRKAAWKHR